RHRGWFRLPDRPGRARRRGRSRSRIVRIFRPTLRIRMALLYGGLVLLVGVSLLFTTIILLEQSIQHVGFFHSPPIVVDPNTGVRPDSGAIGKQAPTSAVHSLL